MFISGLGSLLLELAFGNEFYPSPFSTFCNCVWVHLSLVSKSLNLNRRSLQNYLIVVSEKKFSVDKLNKLLTIFFPRMCWNFGHGLHYDKAVSSPPIHVGPVLLQLSKHIPSSAKLDWSQCCQDAAEELETLQKERIHLMNKRNSLKLHASLHDLWEDTIWLRGNSGYNDQIKG